MSKVTCNFNENGVSIGHIWVWKGDGSPPSDLLCECGQHYYYDANPPKFSEPEPELRSTHSVRDYAKKLHSGQIYYPDRPYIEHLDRVASHFAPDSHEYKVAYLHDAVEDGHCTVMDIRARWGNIVAQHVAAITRTHESYDYYIRNLLKHDIARRVKLADLADNLAGCFVHISNNDKSRNWQNLAARYAKAIRILTP